MRKDKTPEACRDIAQGAFALGRRGGEEKVPEVQWSCWVPSHLRCSYFLRRLPRARAPWAISLHASGVKKIVRGVIFLSLLIGQFNFVRTANSQIPNGGNPKYDETFITDVGELEIYDGIAFVTGFYLASDTNVYDVSNPQWPEEIIEHPFERKSYNFAFKDNLVYSIDYSYSFHNVNTTIYIHQILDDNRFELVGQLKTDYKSEAIEIVEDKIYLLEYIDDNNFTIGVYDVSNPSTIARLGQSQNITGLNNFDFRVYQDLAFIKNDGFEVYNISNPSSIVKIGAIDNPIIGDYFIENDIMYCVTNQSKISIYDVSDFINPILISSYNAGESIRNIEKHSDTLFVKLDLDLLILDITEINSPQKITIYNLNSWSNILIYSDGYLFSSDVLDLQVIDVSDLNDIKILVNIPRLLGYYITTAIVILSLIPIIFITYRYMKSRELELKLADQTKEEEEPVFDIEKEDSSILKLEKALKITAIVFIVQNIIMTLQIVMVILVEFSYTEVLEVIFNVFLAIPLVLDLLCGLVFTIILFIIYLKKKKKNYLFSSISWIGWIGFAITYRIMYGFPNLFNVINSIPEVHPYYGSIFLAASMICFWLAIFLFNYDNKEPIMKNYGFWFAFGNWIFGILLSYSIMVLMESAGPEAMFFGIIGGLIYLLKIALVPLIGIFYFLDLRRKINVKHSIPK